MNISIAAFPSAVRDTIRPSVVALLVVVLAVLGSAPAFAHKGHGGALQHFLKKKEALRAMLPPGAKIVKRKQRLSDEAADWAEQTYGVDLDKSLYTYYLAKDRASGEIIGGAILLKAAYRHGDLEVGVGLDADGRVTKVVLSALSEKYIPEFEGTVGKGFIDGYEGSTVADLVDKARAAESGDKPTRVFTTRLRDAAVLLAAFMRTAR